MRTMFSRLKALVATSKKNNKHSFLIYSILIIIALSLLNASQLHAQREEDDNKFYGNKNKPEREAWLRDLGFGLFLHWSYDSQLGITISHSMVGASNDYLNRYINELPKSFDPYKYDAYHMAMQAKLAGAKYICITAKHHSGYCLWDTKTTDFKITNSPYHKDILKEYVEGARKAGLAVGIYYSPEDFKFLYDNHIPVSRNTGKLSEKVEAAYDALVRKQTRELFTNYGKIDMLFIDGNHKEACKEEAWKLQPDLVITRGAVNSPEQTVPGAVTDRLWESNLTMGTQWEYKPTNDNLKSGTRLIEILVETRAKGGNLLLNVGPKPDGTIADPEERRLAEIATWHFINQEAIHNVRPWIIPNEENIWFTASKDKKTLYAIITGLPNWEKGQRKEFIISSVKTTPKTKISVLGHSSTITEYNTENVAGSYFKQQNDGVHISVMNAQRIYDDNKWPNPITVKLEDIEPALVPPLFQTLHAETNASGVVLKGQLLDLGDTKDPKVGFEYRPYAGFVENLYFNGWKRTEIAPMNQKGDYSLAMNNLEKGKTYEYRFVLVYPNITLYGDRVQVSVK